MSRDRSKRKDYVTICIKPDTSAFDKAFKAAIRTFRKNRGRYWVKFDGGVIRTPGMKPLLRKGGPHRKGKH